MKSFLVSIILTIQAQIQFPPGRIVGGYEVTPKFKYPWIASLQYASTHICGGTWYSGNTIISAAHCVTGETYEWTALMHRHNLKAAASAEHGLAYRVISRTSHPKYDQYFLSFDVSVWKVNAKPNRPIIALDTGKISSSDGTLLTVIGWGHTSSFSSSTSSVLREVKVPVIGGAKCQKAYPELDSKSQFCAGYPEGMKDACQGDSGGPIFVSSGNSYTLVGVVSWGQGCAVAGNPGAYTRVSAVADFIAKHI
ncbi:hypothetical protein DSO57_1024499 [Entomophthora muscae]|uniref:Uncharacterized protein n=1 Tax=Entomophthora muscae TaxID=34485 RepID=A0ACC2T2V9_9FUNG|nr:hypothetical protein DSO57_1024499 [Entomophthora muscae]